MSSEKLRQKSYRGTITACFLGYVVQSVVNTFVPLLFLTFQSEYGIPLAKITMLVTINFFLQLCIDLASAFFVEKIGYRACAVLANSFAAAGLILLTILPKALPDPFVGLLLSVFVYAIGGGLLEVVISPIVEACPSEHKAKTMSLLHSFYCWGSVLVVLVSTLLFRLLGLDSWRIISAMWAVIPACNAIYFCFVPINSLADEGRGMSITGLLKEKVFWVLALLMLCSGASELAMSQWASALAETGLHVSKTAGDLAGPCFFAILMGSGRVLHAHVAERFSLTGYLGACACLCIVSYLVVTFSPLPAISLAACGVCGLSVAAMWPGTFSISSKVCPQGGTTIFALLALAGDIGCSAGPTTVGFVSSALQDNLKLGLLSAIIFPVLMIAGLTMCRKYEK